ncbi:MAG: 6,7-dimethyl-8-ribityllumazine synthase [Dehalococcoidia bacterium]|nr:6,7-dimethyl-8-ribityllumazine synthase [Dehalococcoidia bacterium]MDW8119573.1 6,7-dimethyl-8-ribityllumazine synthase [Chloroflexota bacterium]
MREVQGSLRGEGLRIAIVASRFNSLVTERLVEGAQAALREAGVREEDILLAWVPGSFEIPVVAKHLASSGRFHAVICLGAVIRGETPHFEYVASQAAAGIAQVARETGVPCIFGVLTTEDTAQALERAGGKMGNRGYDAALAAIQMATLLQGLGRNDPH